MGSRVSIQDIAEINVCSYSSKERWELIDYIDTGSVVRGSVNEVQHLDTNKDIIPSRAKRKVRNQSILYSTVRPNQEHFAILNDPADNVLVSTGFAVIDCNEKKVIPRYCYYVLTQEVVTAYFQSLAEQSVSTYPTLNINDLAAFEIDLPDFDTQKMICSILAKFDAKIELNSRLNGYLAA